MLHLRRALATLEDAASEEPGEGIAQSDDSVSEAERAPANPEPPAPPVDVPDPSAQRRLAELEREAIEAL
jgi:hypothetical protein